MPDLLTPEEHFRDRIEIVGYLSLGVNGLALITYFAMLFFFEPVRQQPPGTKLGLLALFASLMTVGFFVPLHREWARQVYRGLFWGMAFFSFQHFVIQGEWPYGLLLAYSFWGLGVLQDPLSIQQFRPLRTKELQRSLAGPWLTWASLGIVFYGLWVLGRGFLSLSQSESAPETNAGAALLSILLATFILFLYGFFRRTLGWARWGLVVVFLALALLHLPSTLSLRGQNPLDYSKTLLQELFFLAVSAYLIFSSRLTAAFPVKTAGSPPPA